MNCEKCRELMLEAEPELVAGIGDEPIAVHLRSCSACHEEASAMLGQLQAARLAYARIEPVSPPPRHAVRSIAWPVAWAAASLAAAAAIVLMVAGGTSSPGQHLVWRNLEQDSTAATIAVEVPEGKNAIVFDTKNPKVSVVWIY